MTNKLKKVLWAALAINVFFVLIYLISLKNDVPTINSESLIQLSSYELTANNSTPIITKNIADLPYVRTIPGAFKYFFIAIVDRSTDKLYHRGGLFYAAKRIAEVKKWGDELRVLENVNNAQELEQWWSENEPKWWQIFSGDIYQTWEATLARYDKFIRYELDDVIKNTSGVERERRLGFLISSINDENRTLLDVISQLPIEPREKSYINYLRLDVYSTLSKLISKYVDSGETNLAEIPLLPILAAHDIGRYNAYTEVSDKPDYLTKDTYLTIGNKRINQTYDDVYNDKVISYKEIPISMEHEFMQLHYTPIDLLEDQSWKEHNQDDLVVYTLRTPTISTNQAEIENLLELTYPIKQKSYFEIVEVNNVESSTSVPVMEDLLLPLTHTARYSRHERFAADKSYEIRLITDKKISSADLAEIQITIHPLFRPVLKLVKVGYLPGQPPFAVAKKVDSRTTKIETHNLTDSNKQYIRSLFGFGWKTHTSGNSITAVYILDLYILALLIGSLILTISTSALYKYHNVTRNITVFGENLIVYIRTKIIRLLTLLPRVSSRVNQRIITITSTHRLSITIVIALVIAVNLLLFNWQNEYAFIFTVALVILLLVMFKANTRDVQNLMYISLALTIISRLFRSVTISSTASIWMFIFLLILLYSLIQDARKQKD